MWKRIYMIRVMNILHSMCIGFLLCVEKSACWGCVTRLSGYVLVQDKDIVHSALDCAAVCRTNAINNHSSNSDGVVGALGSVYKACGSALSWVVSSAVYVLWLVWSVAAAGLQVIGRDSLINSNNTIIHLSTNPLNHYWDIYIMLFVCA